MIGDWLCFPGERGERPGHADGGGAQQHGRYHWPMRRQQSGGDRVSGDAEGTRTGRPDGAGRHTGYWRFLRTLKYSVIISGPIKWFSKWKGSFKGLKGGLFSQKFLKMFPKIHVFSFNLNIHWRKEGKVGLNIWFLFQNLVQ